MSHTIPDYLIKTRHDLKSEYRQLQEYDHQIYAHTKKTPVQIQGNGNRYSDIIPYEDSRVKLSDGGYINASIVIPGLDTDRYIATQGPLKQTVGRFWQCCFEELYVNSMKSVDIVMLTELEERHREKCFDYVSSMETDVTAIAGEFGKSIRYEGLTKLHNDGIELRLFTDVESGQRIRHFWVRKWPDFGIPDKEHDNNLYLVKYIHDTRIDKCSKIVHCSAGVGRSGTFIELDWYFNYVYLKGRQSDIFDGVLNLRKCRVMMVQRFEQYEYLYMAIKEMYEV